MNADAIMTLPPSKAVTIQIQSILYQMDKASIFRALESIARSADLGIAAGDLSAVHVA